MTHPQFPLRTCRPRDAVEQASRDYPGAWGVLDQFRADRGQHGLPDWPAWCYLPMAAAYAVVSGGGTRRVAPERAGDGARRYDLRWMPPIAVAMGEATPAELPAVVRAVR